MKYRTQRDLQRKDARSAYAIPAQKTGKPYKDSWDIDRVMSEAMGKVIPIFRGVHAIADNQARLPFEVRQDTERGAAIEDHDLVRLLNQEPNPDETPYSFRYRLSAQVILSRKGAFIEVVRDRIGAISALYLLDPRRTNPVPSKTLNPGAGGRGQARLVDGFDVDLGGGKSDFLTADRVLWVKLPHPFDPLMGMTPLEAAGLTIDIDVLARLYNRTFLQNDGRPGGIVGVQGEMDDDVADELDARFNQGTRGAGRITVLEADGLDWVDTAVSPRDAQYIEALAFTKVDLLGAIGVPESVAYGNASGRTFDNAAAEWAFFWQSTEMGHLALLGDALNKADQDPSTFVAFDLSDVDVVQRTESAKRAEMRSEVVAGVRTLDSYLEETGEDPLGSPEARSFWRPMGDVPYATEGEAAPVLSLVEEVTSRAVKSALEEMERKKVVAPFRLAPVRGTGTDRA